MQLLNLGWRQAFQRKRKADFYTVFCCCGRWSHWSWIQWWTKWFYHVRCSPKICACERLCPSYFDWGLFNNNLSYEIFLYVLRISFKLFPLVLWIATQSPCLKIVLYLLRGITRTVIVTQNHCRLAKLVSRKYRVNCSWIHRQTRYYIPLMIASGTMLLNSWQR